MAMNLKIPQKVQIRLTSSVELLRASLEPYMAWIGQMLGAPLSESLVLEVDCNPADVVAEELLQGLPVVSATKARNSNWRLFIEQWSLPPGVNPRIDVSPQRERKSNAAPSAVWDIDWQDCPAAFKLRGLAHTVVSVKVPMVFPPGDRISRHSASAHWFLVHREDAAKVLLILQEVQGQTERYLQTRHSRTRLQVRYDWDALVLDSTVRRMVRTDFELFFQREDWFRQHNLPYRRGYLLWGAPGNGKSATIKVMAAHPHIQPFSIDLSDNDEKSSDVLQLFAVAADNTPALVILEDLDRAFPTEGKRTQERRVSFQTLLNCLDGLASQDGVLVVATANDPRCLDAAILKRPERFDRVVHLRNPDADLRREYYRKLSPILDGDPFEPVIQQTEGFSFAQLRETYIMGAQSAFEHGREISVEDVIEAIELQASETRELKTSVGAPGFVQHAELAARR
jgi:hypothetical protein